MEAAIRQFLLKPEFNIKGQTLDDVWGWHQYGEHANIELEVHDHPMIYTPLTSVADLIFRQLHGLRTRTGSMKFDMDKLCRNLQWWEDEVTDNRRTFPAMTAFLRERLSDEFTHKLVAFSRELLTLESKYPLIMARAIQAVHAIERGDLAAAIGDLTDLAVLGGCRRCQDDATAFPIVVERVGIGHAERPV